MFLLKAGVLFIIYHSPFNNKTIASKTFKVAYVETTGRLYVRNYQHQYDGSRESRLAIYST